MSKKLKWKISEKPTGRYAGFQNRAWPMAYFENGKVAVQITCDTSYCLQRAKSGNHDELTVRIADHSVSPWKWRLVNTTFATLENAKAAAIELFEKHPDFKPAE